MDEKKVMLSGIQPSGDLHLGNYLGPLRHGPEMIEEFDCYFFLADLHTITVRQEPAQLRRRVLTLLAQYIACGLDPEKCTFSSNPMSPPTPSWGGCWTATPCSVSCPA